jgi:hypothetical protein
MASLRGWKPQPPSKVVGHNERIETMSNYRLTVDQIEELKEIKGIHLEGIHAPRKHCAGCGAAMEEIHGESGEYFIDGKYLHSKTKVLEENLQDQVQNVEKYASFIFSGYGSIFDYSIIALTKEQDKVVDNMLCNDCLSKILISFGSVDAYQYGLDGDKIEYRPYTFTGMDSYDDLDKIKRLTTKN